MRYRRIASAAAGIVIFAGVTSACGSGASSGANPATSNPPNRAATVGSGALTVGATGQPENTVLAQMYADLLHQAGFAAAVKVEANAAALQGSLQTGAVAVEPQYAATYADSLQTSAAGTESPTEASASLSAVLAELQKQEAKLGLSYLTPSNAVTGNPQSQAADYVIPIVNSSQFALHPQIATAINPLSAVLTTADLARLAHQIESQGRSIRSTARTYLLAHGLLK
jgi:glycine betaine/choline ABC-type transport system substrate-binding protein